MAQSLHPAATHHLPAFITAPGETDVLMVVMALFLVLAVLGFGNLFLRLHTLPERMAHKSKKVRACRRIGPYRPLHAHAYFLDSRSPASDDRPA